MKKTFRKALACLLAVLMVAFSVPFSALAYEVGHTVGEANYQWWDDANPPKARPDYTSFNSTYVFGRTLAKAILTNEKNGNYSKRWDAKPVVGATVSYLGTENDTLEDLEAKLHTYYGKVGYAEAEAAGVIMNPTEIKAGQRIAVTYEFGGLDVMNNGQILSTYDNTKLAAAGYWDEYIIDNDMDTWDFDHTADYGKAAITNSTMSVVPNMDDTEAKVSLLANVAAQTSSSAAFVGNYTDMDAVYGVPVATFFFEALQDCDLTEAITFTEGRGGTVFEWGSEDTGFKDGLKAITFTPEVDSFILFAPPIWTNASSTPAPETHKHDYKSEVTTPATCTSTGVRTWTCQSTTGTCDKPTYTEDIPVDPTAHDFSIEKEIVPGKDCVTTGKTTMECSRCGETTEVDNDVVGNHVYGEPVITKPASCTEEGIKTYTCVYHENESYTESIHMIPHSYENKEIERKDATCTTDGYVITADVCTVCGAEKENSRVNTTLNATDHDWGEWIIDTPATETTEGSKHRVCKNDPTHTETAIIPVVECKHEGTTHEVDVEVVKAATCNAEGIKTVNVICDVCNNVIETKEVAIPIDENNHVGTTSTRDDVTLVATCQATGLKNVVTVCDDCGKDISVEEDVVIPKDADNHVGETTTRDVVITEATCGVDGLKNIETVCGCGTVLSTEENVTIPATGNHTWGDEFEVVTAAPSFDAEGSKDIKHTCSVCDLTETIRTESIAILKSYTVTVDAADMGTVTLAGTDVTNGGSAKFVPGSKVTLTAEAFDGAKFIGWTANGSTLVSTDAEFTTTVLANVKYTPVFEVATDDVFTVTFVDAFGNVVAVCTSDKGIDVPAAPARPGYVAATENGWSMTTDEIKALTASATVTAQYVKAEEATYTVKAAGCDITANGETIADELSVPYDTKVTVTNTSATAWIVKDAKTGEEVKVGYGDSYTFFVTADITLTYDTEAVVATPQVANVGVEAVGTAPRIQAAFKATRTMADDCQYIASGFVYGKGDLGAITLDHVDGKAVKASYNKTDSEQFILTYGLSAQQGTMTAVAFLAYVDADGVNQVAYAAPMTFTY